MIRMLNGWVRVRPDPDASETEGGLIIPEGSIETVYKWATVTAVGGGAYTKKGVEVRPDMAVGDRVCYVFAHERCATNQQVKDDFGGEVFLREKDILLVEEQDGTAEGETQLPDQCGADA